MKSNKDKTGLNCILEDDENMPKDYILLGNLQEESHENVDKITKYFSKHSRKALTFNTTFYCYAGRFIDSIISSGTGDIVIEPNPEWGRNEYNLNFNDITIHFGIDRNEGIKYVKDPLGRINGISIPLNSSPYASLDLHLVKDLRELD